MVQAHCNGHEPFAVSAVIAVSCWIVLVTLCLLGHVAAFSIFLPSFSAKNYVQFSLKCEVPLKVSVCSVSPVSWNLME